MMNLENRLNSFRLLHEKLSSYTENDLRSLANRCEQGNPWFSELNFFRAWKGILTLINNENLTAFSNKYHGLNFSERKVGLVLAGNIPAVGFHDILISLLAGNKLFIKLSSEDRYLIPFLISELKQLDDKLSSKCDFVEKLDLNRLDAIIATGSNNTARYFKEYFSKKPNVIRQSRTSVAVLNGSETVEELELLADDIIWYFGLGCRNVSKILLLNNADIIPLIQVIERRTELGNFSKYDNNYLYYKSIYLVNREPFLDSENMLFKETEELHSPISVLYYQKFDDEAGLTKYLDDKKDQLQCVVEKNRLIGFGQAQKPNILDYPDNIDIIDFFQSIEG